MGWLDALLCRVESFCITIFWLGVMDWILFWRIAETRERRRVNQATAKGFMGGVVVSQFEVSVSSASGSDHL